MKEHPDLIDTKGNEIISDIYNFIRANRLPIVGYEGIEESLFTDAAAFIVDDFYKLINPD